MFKKLLFLFLFFFGCFTVMSQKIVGKILNNISLEPVQNVAIITNLNKGSTSDKNGEFTLQIKNLESVTFSSLGYVTLTLQINELKKLNYKILLKEKIDELDEIQLNLAQISLDSILIKTQRSMKKNYISGGLSCRFYTRENNIADFKKLELELEKSTLLSRQNRKKAEKEFTDYANNLKSSNPNFSSEFYGNITTKKVYSEKFKKYFNKNKIDTVEGFKSMKNKKQITIKKAQSDLQHIVLRHLNKDKTYRVSSGLFKIEDSLSMKEVIDEADSAQIKNSFNEYFAVSDFNTASFKARFFRFNKNMNFFNQKFYTHTLEENTLLGGKMMYVLNFEPDKSRSKYSGRIFINPNDFTVAKIEYQFADGKRGMNVNLKWILGIKVSEDLNKVTLLYEKNKEDKVYLSYYKETRGNYAYAHRPIKFKENSSTKNKVKFDIKVEIDTKETTEVLVLDVFSIKKENIEKVEKKAKNKRFTYMSLDDYNNVAWKNRQLITDYLKKWE